MQDTRTLVPKRSPVGGLVFDWLIAALSLWFVGGAYVDGWAHNHDLVEDFFTPWHAVLYSGYAVTAAAIVGAVLLNKKRGYGWRESIPEGYQLSLAGVFVFFGGGVLDMLWHLAFGIEKDVEALLSPTHLLLALGAVLMTTGPFRAAWRRPGAPRGWRGWLPMLISLSCLAGLIAFMTQFAHPLKPQAIGMQPLDEDMADLKQIAGISGILLQTAFVMGAAFVAMRRWKLPPGTFTFLFGSNAVAMVYMKDEFRLIVPAVLSGILADLLYARLRPTYDRMRQLRGFAFLVPVVFFIAYFAALMLTGGIWWSVHFWTGSIALAGTVSWLMTYLMVPPKIPLDTEKRPD
jgi:hypothetical protein